MDDKYLHWMKELEIATTNRSDVHLLLASSVSQPNELLMADLKLFSEQIDTRIPFSNAYGHPLLINAIAKRYGVSYGNVAITNGVSNGIYLICRALLDKGDHVIVETPVYQSLKMVPEMIGAEISFAERGAPDYDLDIEQVINYLKPSTKMILMTNLHNPTGAFTSDDQLLELARAAKGKNPDIKIFVDEIYRDFLPGDISCAYELDDCFISLNSLTKVYGLGIIHQGWLIADEKIINKIKLLQNLVEGAGSRLLESFASLIVENLESYRERALELMRLNAEILSQCLQPIVDKGLIAGMFPQYGCVYFPKVNSISSTDKLVQQLIDQYQIYIVAGKFFDSTDHIRIGFGGESGQSRKSLGRFAEALINLI